MKLSSALLLVALIPFFSLAAQEDSTKPNQSLSTNPSVTYALSLANVLDTMDQSGAGYPILLELCRSELHKTLREEIYLSNWEDMRELAKAYLKIIETGKEVFPEGMEVNRYWAYKNMIVAYFGLNHLDSASIYQDSLYAAYNEKRLPEGLDTYYNFEKFVWNDLNVWGYEWYPDLGDPESAGSFTKNVYYIYSRKADGTDDEQLYRLHVLKVHKIDDKMPDFVLTAYFNPGPDEIRQTLWAFTYSNPVDYVKLRKDVRVAIEKIQAARTDREAKHLQE